ncbi:MAG TPA: hypothetical protein VHB20_02930 [Verrucomicrobiae bacterium]|nr:hypothetical protein [Verrucomicrobiae bacterium]
MTVAPKEERMKFQVEKNEIAGPVTQKLPTTGSVSSAAVVAAPASTAKLRVPVDFSGRDNSIEQFTINNASKAAVETSAPAAPALSPADRVEQLISREVVSFKSSGADHVGVALKIDAHTQLFLELSYRDGQTQAVLRCDKGDLPAFTAHFGQLQESLARQNIQLQPSSQGASLGGNNTSGGQRQQQAPAADYAAAEPVRPVAIKKSKTATFSRQGWESWA